MFLRTADLNVEKKSQIRPTWRTPAPRPAAAIAISRAVRAFHQSARFHAQRSR